jgi:hypothetical protein
VQRFRSTIVAVFIVAVMAALAWLVVLSLSGEASDTAGIDAHVSLRVSAPLRDLPRSLG